MVRITGNIATNAGVAISGATAVYFPTSVNATETTVACSGIADTSNSSGVFQDLAAAANKYDIRVNCGSAFRWSRYADEVQHATFQTGDGCSSGLEGNYYVGLANDAGMRWSTADASNHALVIGVGDTSQQVHVTDSAAMNTDWGRSAGTHPELAIHSNTTPITDYIAIGNHDGTTGNIDVVGGTTLALKIAGNTEASITAAGLVLPACSDLSFTGTTGTNDIVLTNGLADALSITDGSADIILVDTSTSGNVITMSSAVTVSNGLTSTAVANTLGATSFNDAAITNVGDIALDSISADGTDINIAVDDNSATALTIKQGSDAYLIIDTANSSESVSIGTGISGTAITLGHGTSEVTVADNLTVAGDMTVNGTTTTVNSTTLTVDDPIITLGGDSAPGSDDNKDRGVEFRYHDGSSARVGFFGYDDSASVFTGLTVATNSSEVFSGTVMNAVFGTIGGTLSTAAQTNITSLGTLTGLTLSGDATLTGAATDVDLIDNNACAISFDASGQAGILAIDTQNCAEGVKMSAKLGVTGVLTATGGIELSHATANTLTASSGVLSIEGNRVFHAGGADVPVADGGTDISVYAVGDIVYASGTTTLSKLTKGNATEVLTMGGSNAPTWAAPAAAGVSVGLTIALG